MRVVPLTWPNLLGRPSREIQPRERLFLEIGGGGSPMQHTAAHDTAFSERHQRAGGATTLDSSPAARAGQHVATSHVVPAHQVSLDCVFPEQHRHWIVDMSGRNVSVRIHALQSLNQSLFECVAHHGFQLDTLGSLCKLGGRQPSAAGRGPSGAWLDEAPPSSSPFAACARRVRWPNSGEVQGETLEIGERAVVEGAFVSSPQDHAGCIARLQRFEPAGRTREEFSDPGPCSDVRGVCPGLPWAKPAYAVAKC
jgi:hypothetical protein